MATTTAEQRNLPSTTGDGHKHKKSALSDGQGRLAWMLLAPTLLIIVVVAGIPVIMSIRESLFTVNTGVDPNTGLVARARPSPVCRTSRTSSLARTMSPVPTGPWTGSGTPS